MLCLMFSAQNGYYVSNEKVTNISQYKDPELKKKKIIIYKLFFSTSKLKTANFKALKILLTRT